MNIFLQFLAQIVVHKTVNELNNNGTSILCANPIPGIERLLRGIDITKLDLHHDYSVDQVDGFAQEILDLTCNEGKQWVSPFDRVRYDVPDQVNAVSALPTGLLYTETLLETNMNEVRRSMTIEAGLETNLSFGLFSASLSYRHSQDILTNSSRFLASSKAFVSTTQLDLIPGQFLETSLNKYFLLLLDKLPDTYEGNPSLYQELFSTYGTHYYASAYFGGSLLGSFDIAQSYRKSTSDDEVKVNAEASFLGILKAHGAYDGNVNTVSEAFKAATHASERYYGGVANLFDVEGFSKWWPTIFSNPWLYGGRVLPISNILKDGPKKESVTIGTQVYAWKSYLKELERLLSSCLNQRPDVYEDVQYFLKLISNCMNEVIPMEAEVEQLGNAVYVFVEECVGL